MARWIFGNILAKDRQAKQANASAEACRSCAEKDLEIDLLRRELKAAHARISKLTHTSPGRSTAHDPPSSEDFKGSTSQSADGDKKKNGGAKRGHVGKSRPPSDPSTADEVIDVVPSETCRHCGGNMSSTNLSYFRRVLDVSRQAVKELCYKVPVCTCTACGTSSAAAVSALPRSILGNRLLATIAVEHYLYGISVGTIRKIYDLKGLSEGALHNALDQLGRICRQAHDQLVKDYRGDKVRHADETSWRVDGAACYSWVFASLRTAIFIFGVSRAALTPKSIFGEEKLGGALVVDRYAGYNRLPVALQYCFAHLLRDSDELEEKVTGTTFCSEFSDSLKAAMALQKRLSLSNDEYYREAGLIADQILELLTRDESDPGVRSLQASLLDEADRLFLWSKDRDVPATNNYAERTVRNTVKARKVSFGSQSKQGAQRRGHITSVLTTAVLRSRGDPIDWLTDALDKIARDPKINIYSLLPS